ncbi:MAG TPA: helical backbone metal receptor [Anaerolineales bacterium]|nr:helical backbone metal receptor [Anaerolineales bacterium]
MTQPSHLTQESNLPLFQHPPRRVVSLVPSITESLFDLGLGGTVVGITDYCIYPEEQLAGLVRVGGPKNPDVQAILGQQPDLVLANQEENTRQAVAGLQAAGIAVWVSFPRSVDEALEVLFGLAGIFQQEGADDRVRSLSALVEQTRASRRGEGRRKYFCPIWSETPPAGQRWWMTFNRDTYMHDLLELLGGENIFALRERRYPLEADLGLAEPKAAPGRDRRYPRVIFEEIRGAGTEMILLPSEPYAFGEAHRREMAELFPGVRIVQVEGSLLTWHGTRLGRALRELAGLFG